MSSSPERAPPPVAFACTEVDHRSNVAQQQVRWPVLPSSVGFRQRIAFPWATMQAGSSASFRKGIWRAA
jgi:hypothetical protein